MKNPCIETTTAKKVVEGRIISPNCSASCTVKPEKILKYGNGVELRISSQVYSKRDLKHLIDMLSEIHEALVLPEKITKTDCNCAQCKDFEKDVR